MTPETPKTPYCEDEHVSGRDDWTFVWFCAPSVAMWAYLAGYFLWQVMTR